ncbi:hypothetical protein [Burkholderia stagnalis]|uniref:hypothetical protein n=1 Tax=Burkholderia stagnalis TaxID=1503054 RepID=UPI0021AB3387|nr:hypothetical protein [Burkholderia stagnalis]
MRLVHFLIVALLFATVATANAAGPAPAPKAAVHFDTHGDIVVAPGTIAKPAGLLDRAIEATEATTPLGRIVDATEATTPLGRIVVETESRSSMQLAGVIAATEAKRGHDVLGAVAEATIAHINLITGVGGTIAGGMATAACTVGSGMLGIAACAAIGAVVGTSVQLGLNGLIRWAFSSKPSLTIEEVAKATGNANASCPTEGFVNFYIGCTGNTDGATCWPDPNQTWRGWSTYFTVDVKKLPMNVQAFWRYPEFRV